MEYRWPDHPTYQSENQRVLITLIVRIIEPIGSVILDGLQGVINWRRLLRRSLHNHS